MLKSYAFVVTDHQKLHNHVIAFFDRIEHEAGEFSLEFFEEEFRPIVKSHYKVLKRAFTDIYNEIKTWEQADRSYLCEEIRQSNSIEQICSGQVNPRSINDTETGTYEKIRTLFLKLYSDVLDGDPVRKALGVNLRQHFNTFRMTNNHITLCPMCGISELATEHDTSRDPYDHYLPESLYPLSAVNFYNLIPTCTKCNSPDIKGAKDVIAIRNTRLFYPYDQNHQGIRIIFSIQQDSLNINDIVWQVEFQTPDAKDQEVEAWKEIYNIEDRYIGFVKGRIEKWHRAFWHFLKNSKSRWMTKEQKIEAFFTVLEAFESEDLNFIIRPAFSEFLDVSQLEKARQEAEYYS